LELDQKADLPSQIQDSTASSLRFNRSWERGDAKPKVSVVIPCFNQGVFLPEALASVESYAPLETEVLITNDGSTDPETLTIVANLKKAGYQILNQANQGLSKTRNRMVELAQAEIILPLDADNRICPNFINEGLKLFESQPQTGIIYGNRVDFGMRRGEVDVPQFEVGTMLQENYIDACALIRKSVIEACDGYDYNVKALEDWELWVHAAAKGFQFAKLQFNTFEYRVRPRSMLSFVGDPQNKKDIVEYVQQKHFRFYISWFEEQAIQLKKQLSEYEERLKQFSLSEQHLYEQQMKLEDEIKQKEADLILRHSEYVQLNQTLDQIQSSKSWQITAPLRGLFSRFRGE
jgi:glycosyltransferase involved in cell wall biosynthesis